MKPTPPIAAWLRSLDKRPYRRTARALLDAGRTAEEVADDIARILDAAIPLDLLVPGVGALLELADGPVIRACALAIVRAVQKGREKAAARKLGLR